MLCRLLIVTIFATYISAGNPSPPPVYKLEPVASKTGSAFAFGFFHPVGCDSEGNIYLRVDAAGTFAKDPVWKFSSQAEKKAEFSLPSQPKDLRMAGFSASPDAFYELAYDDQGTYLLIFEPNGPLSQRTKLATPEGFQGGTIAAFSPNRFLITGDIPARSSKTREPYAGIFSGAGDLVKALGFQGSNDPTSSRIASVSADGYVYALVENRVYKIDASGKASVAAEIAPPEGYRAVNVAVSQGVLSIEFAKILGDHRVLFRFRTYGSDSVTPVADYVPSEELGTAPLCFAANEGYTFYHNEGGKVQILRGWIH